MFKIRNKYVQEAVSFAGVLLAVFAFRSTFFEPYVVPTGSMMPTILPGDRLIANKMAFDLKFPFTQWSLFHVRDPKRGEIIVFQHPKDPSMNLVKRLIGLPGETVTVKDGKVWINGAELTIRPVGTPGVVYEGETPSEVYEEQLDDHFHTVQRLAHFPTTDDQSWQIPEGHYFFMGDNRDNSADSRFWGFVPKENLKGKAMAIWFSFHWEDGQSPEVRWKRIGNSLSF